MKRRYTLAFLLLCTLPVLCPAQRAEIPAGVNPSSDSLHRTVAPNPPSDPDSLRLSRIDSELSALVGRDSTFRREVDVTSGRLSLSELLRTVETLERRLPACRLRSAEWQTATRPRTRRTQLTLTLYIQQLTLITESK